jgi:glycosyltransferase involved in cell wall biosynthesis
MKSRPVKTVAIVHNAYGRISGEETAIENLTALLEKRGITVHRFSRSSAEIGPGGLGKISAFFSGLYNPFARKAFRQFLKESKPDIVHIHNLYPLISPSILPACKTFGVPVVMTVHNFRLACPNGLLMSHEEICHRCLGGKEYWCMLRNCENSFFKSTGYALRTMTARILRFYYKHVSHFICVSEFQKNILIREGLPANRVSVMANPLSLSNSLGDDSAEGLRVHPPSIPPLKGGKNADDSVGGGYVAYVGRISPEKDVSALMEAARGLLDTPFKCAGDYQRMPELPWKKPANCEFLGQLNAEEIAKFYSNARMVVFATRCYEGFPTVLLEAMSHGLPIVCSRIGGLPEIIEDDATGLLYEPGNAKELAEKIRMLWNDPALCLRMGKAGRKKLEEQYSPDRLLDQLLGIYEKVIKEKDRALIG